tara:strand:- start:235 stop:513 length:279 start_codon:yes stop_codon:yes gene_type:complete
MFKTNYDKILMDTARRNNDRTPVVPDTFYDIYAGALLLILIKCLLIMILTSGNQIASGVKTNFVLGIVGMSILAFLLLLAMHIVITFYVTDG